MYRYDHATLSIRKDSVVHSISVSALDLSNFSWSKLAFSHPGVVSNGRSRESCAPGSAGLVVLDLDHRTLALCLDPRFSDPLTMPIQDALGCHRSRLPAAHAHGVSLVDGKTSILHVDLPESYQSEPNVAHLRRTLAKLGHDPEQSSLQVTRNLPPGWTVHRYDATTLPGWEAFSDQLLDQEFYPPTRVLNDWPGRIAALVKDKPSADHLVGRISARIRARTLEQLIAPSAARPGPVRPPFKM